MVFSEIRNLASGTNPVSDKSEQLAEFDNQLYGVRLGGPIIKDKLFFFVNFETENRNTPLPFTFSGYEGNATADSINALVNYVKNEYGYEPGSYTNIASTTEGQKFFIKLNWNVNANHRLSLRHSNVTAETITLGDNNGEAPNSRRIVFQNYGYKFPTTTNSTAFEWNGQFGNNFSNKLIIGVTSVNDDRDIEGSPFPSVVINDGANAQIIIGTNNFSYSNIVKQQVITLTDNFTWYSGDHTFTFGTHNEFFNIQNLFTVFSTPQYQYNTLNDFLSGNPGFMLYGHEIPNPGNPIRLGDAAENLGPSFNAMQMAFYVQDEWQVKPNFKLNLGLRVDIPVYLEDAPLNNIGFNDSTVKKIGAAYDLKGAKASTVPKTTPLLGPRIGFNWDLKSDQTLQLRGGFGIFTSRIPWVWPAGIYIRNGLNAGFNLGVKPFYAKPEEWVENLSTTNSPSGDVDLFVEDFKYPQNLRASLGFDAVLPWGLVGSVELSYNKTINNILVKQVNSKPSTATLQGTDPRPIYDGGSIESTYGRITLLDNTNQGGGFNFTAELKKSFASGFAASLAYSYTDSRAIFDGTAFINSSQWRGLATVNGRNTGVPLSRSVFSTGSRITAFLSYTKKYAGNLMTTVALFFNGQSGRPFSYVYNDGGTGSRGLTNEDSEDNRSLIYIPRSASEITFVGTAAEQESQWYALNKFIENDKYLRERRGQYAERNSNRTPFEGIFDFKITQEFGIKMANGEEKCLASQFRCFQPRQFTFPRREAVPCERRPFPTYQIRRL